MFDSLVASMSFLMQEGEVPGGGLAALFAGVGMIIWLAVALIVLVAFWKIFTKAGEPGWAVIIPIYNLIVFIKICGKPLWWFILCLIPFVNFIVMIILCIELAKRFGKGAGFGLGLAFLGIIFAPILAFSDARYQG